MGDDSRGSSPSGRRGMASPGARRSLKSAAQDASPETPGKTDPTSSKPSYREHLDRSKTAMAEVLKRATGKISEGLRESIAEGLAQGSFGQDEESMKLHISTMLGGVGGVFEWITLQASDVLGTLSDDSQMTSRDQLKTQSVSYEMKLAHQRTASDLKMQAAEIAQEANFNRKLEEKVRIITGNSGAELEEANRKLEELTEEFSTFKLKASGVEEALHMAQQLLSKSENKCARLEKDGGEKDGKVEMLEKEVAKCKEDLAKALKELGVTVSEKTSLEERVAQLVARYEEQQKQHAQKTQAQLDELEGARKELKNALAELGIAQDEKRTLGEQIRDLLERVTAAEAGGGDLKRLKEEAEAELDSMTRERDNLQMELSSCQRERDSYGNELGELKATVSELEGELAEMRASANREEAAAEKMKMLQQALERKDQQAKEERERLEAEVARLLDELEQAKAAGGSGFEQAQKEKQRADGLEQQIAVGKQALEKALEELGVVIEENTTLQQAIEQISKKSAEQHAEVADARKELEEAMKALGVANDEKMSLKDKVESLAEQIRQLMSQVNVKITEARGDSDGVFQERDALKQECAALAQERDAVLAELGTLRERVAELEEQIASMTSTQKEMQEKVDMDMGRLSAANAELQLELTRMKEAAGQGGVEVMALREKAERLEKEIGQCKATLNKGFETMRIQEVKRAESKAQAGRRGARAEAAPVNPMCEMVDTMVEKYKELEASLDRMNEDLAKATSTLNELREKCNQQEKAGSLEVQAVQAAARKERQVLVNAALGSLHSLRTHLVATLSGLRESAPPIHKAMAHHAATTEGTRLAWHAGAGRWAIHSEGMVDHMILRLEVPPMGVYGPGVNGGARHSPNSFRRGGAGMRTGVSGASLPALPTVKGRTPGEPRSVSAKSLRAAQYNNQRAGQAPFGGQSTQQQVYGPRRSIVPTGAQLYGHPQGPSQSLRQPSWQSSAQSGGANGSRPCGGHNGSHVSSHFNIGAVGGTPPLNKSKVLCDTRELS